MALCGNDERAATAAAKLLRVGTNHGRIELDLGGDSIVTELVRDRGRVRVQSPQITALQSGTVLCLGFPALRGASLKAPKGATQMDVAEPSPEDVLPLLSGTVDSRLDGLRQWAVNTFYAAHDHRDPRSGQMLEAFRRIIEDMVPLRTVKIDVDRRIHDVILDVGDGPVPFDAISQGMSSIFNWVGVLLQRLYDIYPQSDASEQEPALVLLDEIDAHLHPDWQRGVAELTRKHFPNVQIIATSHSPLLAGALRREEILVLRRNSESGQIVAEQPLEDLKGQKAEAILTSSLFDMETTREPEAERLLKRYLELRAKPNRSDPEEGELRSLGGKFEALHYGASPVEAKIAEMVRATLEAETRRSMQLTDEQKLAIQRELGASILRTHGEEREQP